MGIQEELQQVIERLGITVPTPQRETLDILGFPSPAEAYTKTPLKPNDFFKSNPTATFYLRHTVNSMVDAKIFHRDVLLYDPLCFMRKPRLN